ncbi:MAG: 50S ribosomal protein L9 [Dethiosulfovibrio peptidovorans]|nr:MAG: 50S ribosomal protein L9 [Dethiosulfovibrio peptidovorans]
MKVILMDEVRKLGKKNEVLEVSDGYARNFLFPRKLAIEATKGNLNKLQDQENSSKKKDQQARAQAEEERKHLQNRQVTVSMSAGEGGRLFGSVTTAQIVEAIREQFDVNVDKKNVRIADVVKTLGHYPCTVRLYQGVEASMTLKVEDR